MNTLLPNPKENKKTCFVIMPFLDRDKKPESKKQWNAIFDFIKCNVEKATDGKYEVFRSEGTPGSIPRMIYTYLDSANIVIADCTDQNANVHYELGIRHCRKLGTILIAQNRDDFPFDTKTLGSIVYNINEEDKFREKIKEHIQYIEGKPQNIDSEVGEVLEIDYRTNKIRFEIECKEIRFGKKSTQQSVIGCFSLSEVLISNPSNKNNSVKKVNFIVENTGIVVSTVEFMEPGSGKKDQFPINITAGEAKRKLFQFGYDNISKPPPDIKKFSFIARDIQDKIYTVDIYVGDKQEQSNGVIIYPITRVEQTQNEYI